jgi:superfamily I DNA/RNA helicase
LATDIAKQSARQKGKAAKTGPSVGVVVMGGKDKWSRERIERELMQSILNADDSAIVRRYDWKTYKGEGKFTFDEPETITIVNAFTQKGLEWDHVYVYVDGFELEPSETENVIQLMQLYVATSRPREKLCIAWTMTNFRGRGSPEIVRRFLEQPLRQKIVEDWNE